MRYTNWQALVRDLAVLLRRKTHTPLLNDTEPTPNLTHNDHNTRHTVYIHQRHTNAALVFQRSC